MAVSEGTTPAEPYEGSSNQVHACLEVICDGVTATSADLRALNDDDIRRVEADQPVPLSDAYRAFLRAAGGGAGRFLQGSDVFYPHLLGIRAAAGEIMAANGLSLEEDDRVILIHQGSQLDFTRGRGTDPEVWSYTDGDDGPTPVYPCFTAWLAANVEEQTQAWVRLAPWQALTDAVKNRA